MSERNVLTKDSVNEWAKQLCKPSRPLRATGVDPSKRKALELCFLIDCSKSMDEWIKKVHSSLNQLHDKIDCDSLRLSFIGYRGIFEHDRFVIQPFTEDRETFEYFVSTIKAKGSEQLPADVLGGLKMCLHQDWTKEAVKKVIMISKSSEALVYYEGTDMQVSDLMKDFAEKNV